MTELPAPNLYQYKKLRELYNNIEADYLCATGTLDMDTYGFGIKDGEDARVVLQSLETLKTEVNELIIMITATLKTSELKEKSASDFKEILKNLTKYKQSIPSLIREISEMI